MKPEFSYFYNIIWTFEVDSLTQFKLTIDSDGIIPALRGLMLYNSYSVSARQKWSDISKIILSNLPSVRKKSLCMLLFVFIAIEFYSLKLVPKRNPTWRRRWPCIFFWLASTYRQTSCCFKGMIITFIPMAIHFQTGHFIIITGWFYKNILSKE